MHIILLILNSCLLAFFNLSYADHFAPSLASEKNKEPSQEFLVEQIEHIKGLSKTIQAGGLDDSIILCLYNERGIAYFFMGEFDNSLNDFNHVLTQLQIHQNLEKEFAGTALWGRLLCHAFQNKLQETYDDSLLIHLLFMECTCCEDQVEKKQFVPVNCPESDFLVLPIAKFAHPEERINKWQCHDRANRLADKMRILADFIPVFAVRELVFWTIDRLANKAHTCCEKGYQWTECLGPIADAWQKLDDTWDQLVDLFKKGIPIEAFITTPGNS